jgi:hypothetical protein
MMLRHQPEISPTGWRPTRLLRSLLIVTIALMMPIAGCASNRVPAFPLRADSDKPALLRDPVTAEPESSPRFSREDVIRLVNRAMSKGDYAALNSDQPEVRYQKTVLVWEGSKQVGYPTRLRVRFDCDARGMFSGIGITSESAGSPVATVPNNLAADPMIDSNPYFRAIMDLVQAFDDASETLFDKRRHTNLPPVEVLVRHAPLVQVSPDDLTGLRESHVTYTVWGEPVSAESCIEKIRLSVVASGLHVVDSGRLDFVVADQQSPHSQPGTVIHVAACGAKHEGYENASIQVQTKIYRRRHDASLEERFEAAFDSACHELFLAAVN